MSENVVKSFARKARGQQSLSIDLQLTSEDSDAIRNRTITPGKDRSYFLRGCLSFYWKHLLCVSYSLSPFLPPEPKPTSLFGPCSNLFWAEVLGKLWDRSVRWGHHQGHGRARTTLSSI